MEKWADGIYLLGAEPQFDTGCWFLENAGQAAVVEMPPYSSPRSPWDAAKEAEKVLNARVKYLLCTHCHHDHIAPEILRQFHKAFPTARTILHRDFRNFMTMPEWVEEFRSSRKLSLGGEALHIIHAPKHSRTDTMIIFSGCVIPGDWEFNTVRSCIGDDEPDGVPRSEKIRSINRMIGFLRRENYRVHKIFPAHANHRRDDVDFPAVLEDTKTDRPF